MTSEQVFERPAEQPREPEIEAQDLLWLLDAPLFIDEKQVNSFYNAVVRPDILDDPKDGGVSMRPKSIKIEVTRKNSDKLSTKLGSEFKLGLGSLFGALFPSAEGTLSGEVASEAGQEDGKGTTLELEPVENPQRQLIHLGVHYLINVTDRLFLVNKPFEENWRDPDTILKSPRALVFLDLPPSIIIPTATEFENNKIELLYLKLQTKLGEGTPAYPETSAGSAAQLQEERRNYWNWYRDNFRGSKAIQVIEEAASENGRIRWIDYRMPLNDEGDTLHLHVCPNGKYDTGVLAYNFIKRGQKHGLRLVGTLKSEPDMNVLAVYEK